MRKLLSLLMVAALASWAWAQPNAQPPAPRVQIAAFQQVGPLTQYDWVGRGIQQALLGDLSRGGVQVEAVASPPSTQSSTAQFSVTGTYQILEPELRITGQVVDLATGRVLGGLKATGSMRDLFSLEDELSRQIRQVLPQLAPAPVTTAQAGTEPPTTYSDVRVDRGAVRPYVGSDLQQAVGSDEDIVGIYSSPSYYYNRYYYSSPSYDYPYYSYEYYPYSYYPYYCYPYGFSSSFFFFYSPRSHHHHYGGFHRLGGFNRFHPYGYNYGYNRSGRFNHLRNDGFRSFRPDGFRNFGTFRSPRSFVAAPTTGFRGSANFRASNFRSTTFHGSNFRAATFQSTSSFRGGAFHGGSSFRGATHVGGAARSGGFGAAHAGGGRR